MPVVIDLFAGAGGLSLGATRAGFSVAAAFEIDSHAIASHTVNFPNTIHIKRDVMALDGQTIFALSGIQRDELIGVIGGPPCQGFSSIGKGNADDARNTLFLKFFQLIEQLHPLFFVAENVPGIMNDKYNYIREMAFQHVQDYNVLPPICINASEYGAPTTRTRYFFVGYLNDRRIRRFSEQDIHAMKVSQDQITNVHQALEGIPGKISYKAHSIGIGNITASYYADGARHIQNDFFFQRVTGMIPNGVGDPEYFHLYFDKHKVNGVIPTQHSESIRKRYSELKYGQKDEISKSVRLDPNNFCPTLRAGTGPDKGSFQAVRPIHYKYARVITPREAARLQGFPDWYKLPDTIWHCFRQIGNSVSPIVAEQVLRAIYHKLTL